MAASCRKADITPRRRAKPDFAMTVGPESVAIGEQHVAALRTHGFTDQDARDFGPIAALFRLSNRMASLTVMQPNAESCPMGRVPKPAATRSARRSGRHRRVGARVDEQPMADARLGDQVARAACRSAARTVDGPTGGWPARRLPAGA